MTPQQLQQALANAQNAYLALCSGSQGESFSYTQGDGSKTVTFTRTNLAQLSALIRQLQQASGIVRVGRRPARFRF
ncbi:gpW family head-tail joining protein [Chromobacterium haemolyticum]